MTTKHTVPSVSVSSTWPDPNRWNVVILRRGDFTTFEVGSRVKAEKLAAEIRGALADAYHAGVEEEAASMSSSLYPAGRALFELPPPKRGEVLAFEDADGDWYWNDGRAPHGDYRYAHSKTSALHDAGRHGPPGKLNHRNMPESDRAGRNPVT